MMLFSKGQRNSNQEGRNRNDSRELVMPSFKKVISRVLKIQSQNITSILSPPPHKKAFNISVVYI